jgi:hypothetical protein
MLGRIIVLAGARMQCATAAAMDYSLLSMPDGLRVVFANGEIVAGDSERLRSALHSGDRDPYGNKSLALNSPGGGVAEAMAIVAVMDAEKVTTIVPPGAVCASACAQVIFVSGAHRVVLDGGTLGIHSCSSAGTKLPLYKGRICSTQSRAADRGALPVASKAARAASICDRFS